MKPYPEYKESQVEWLPLLPRHWEIKKVKFLLQNGNSGMKIGPFGSALKLEDMSAVGVKVYGQENVIGNDFSLGLRRVSNEKYSGMLAYAVKARDILITMMGTSGRCAICPDSMEPGIIDSHLLRIRVNSTVINPEFFALLLDKSHFVKSQVEIGGKGSIMHGLNSGIVKELLYPLPPLPEQRAIAAYLDRETAKIDNLIAKQEQLIALLEEKRQALISHAVTKGLDPHVKMKDSGVEWLGQVPEHWEVRKLKNAVDTKITDGPHETPKIESQGIPFLSAEAVKDNKLDFTRIRGYVAEELHREFCKKVKPRRNDIFMVKSGATTGNIAIVDTDEEFSIWSPLALIRTQKKVLPKFTFYYLQSKYFRTQVELYWSFGTQQNIGMGVLENLMFFVPPKDEQEAIIAHLESSCNIMDKLKQKGQSAIELLKEKRSALISAAVTGKIDVRDQVPIEP